MIYKGDINFEGLEDDIYYILHKPLRNAEEGPWGIGNDILKAVHHYLDEVDR